MSANYKNFIITFLTSFVVGCGATLIVANSENGYTAGFVFLPLFFLICITTLALFISGIVCLILKSKFAPWLLLSAVLLLTFFLSSAMIAKHFEIGAYRQDPMISFSDEVSNVVIFKEGATNDQIEDFWQTVMSSKRSDGRGYETIPGVRTTMRTKPRNGQDAISFSFFSNATEDQRQFVISKIKSSPIVYQILENQPNEPNDNSSSNVKNRRIKKIKMVNLTNNKKSMPLKKLGVMFAVQLSF